MVLTEWEELSKLQQVEATELQIQVMACTATELYNRFVPSLQVFDADNVETGREIRYVIGADQLFQVLGDAQMITHQIVNRVVAEWEKRYGKPNVN